MIRIGLISDTHSFFHPRLNELFKECDQIWHCGDIGSEEVLVSLRQIGPTIAVFGNIDGGTLRSQNPAYRVFMVENVKVFMTHIGGYPNKYDKTAYEIIKKEKPKLFVCGHSHITKVMYDPKHELLHINPGAAGKYGWHKVKTVIRFSIENDSIKDLQVIELS